MIDIHSHIVYAVDDGARNLEESVAMLRMAAAHGTTDIVATPHANSTYLYDAPLIDARILELQQACGDTPRVHRGCDFHLMPENIDSALAGPGKYSINGRGFLLVEFPDFFLETALGQVLDRLLAAGLLPVITHPERNPILQNRVDLLTEWVARGCLVQITALSLTGGFGRTAKAACERLFRRGLVHFVASDAHDCHQRPPELGRARVYLERYYGDSYAAILLDQNPRAVLGGGPIASLPGKSARRWIFQ